MSSTTSTVTSALCLTSLALSGYLQRWLTLSLPCLFCWSPLCHHNFLHVHNQHHSHGLEQEETLLHLCFSPDCGHHLLFSLPLHVCPTQEYTLLGSQQTGFHNLYYSNSNVKSIHLLPEEPGNKRHFMESLVWHGCCLQSFWVWSLI